MRKGPSLVKPVFILLAFVKPFTNILILLKYETLI